jgi:hypothetical protein
MLYVLYTLCVADMIDEFPSEIAVVQDMHPSDYLLRLPHIKWSILSKPLWGSVQGGNFRGGSHVIMGSQRTAGGELLPPSQRPWGNTNISNLVATGLIFFATHSAECGGNHYQSCPPIPQPAVLPIEFGFDGVRICIRALPGASIPGFMSCHGSNPNRVSRCVASGSLAGVHVQITPSSVSDSQE